MTLVVPSCFWYKQLVVHIDVPILTISHNLKSGHPLKASFTEVNRSLTPAIHFECHQPKLINHLSWSSIRMPSTEANQPFSHSSIRMPLAEANLVIHLPAILSRMPLAEANLVIHLLAILSRMPLAEANLVNMLGFIYFEHDIYYNYIHQKKFKLYKCK